MIRKRNWPYLTLALVSGFLGGVVAIELAPTVATAAHRSNRHHVVRANKFELTGADGAKRAILEVTPRDVADLAMFDGNGHDRAEFRVAKDGAASVGFYDDNGARRVMVGESPTGRNGIALYGTNGRQMLAGFTVSPDNQASLTLYDPKTGRARIGLGVASNGSPAMVLFDQNGKDRVEVHVTTEGKPGLALADKDGKTIAALPQQPFTPAESQEQH